MITDGLGLLGQAALPSRNLVCSCRIVLSAEISHHFSVSTADVDTLNMCSSIGRLYIHYKEDNNVYN